MIAEGLVLLHGWAMNTAVWGDLPWPPVWRNKITALELPGHGRNRKRVPMNSLQDLADWLIDQVPENRVWLGWSLGGMVMLQAVATLAVQQPAKLPVALVLVAVTPKFVNDASWNLGVDAAVLDRFSETFIDYRIGVRNFLQLQLGNRGPQRALAAHIGQALLAQPAPSAEVLSSGIDILRNLDLRPLLSSVPVPVKVVQGGRDRICSAAAAHYLVEQLPHAESIFFPRLGHMPFVEQPQRFVDAVCADWV